MADEANGWRIAFSLFKVAIFLAVGSLIGFLLGLAYASHLFGTPPVVTQLQNWFAGDSLYEGPAAVDQADKTGHLSLLTSPVDIIPKIGACVGFAMACSVFVSSYVLRIVISSFSKKSKKNVPEPPGE